MESETPREKPWPQPVDAKGPLALVALVGVFLLHVALLLLQVSRPVTYDTTIQLAQCGIVTFWLAAGVSPRAIRLMISAAVLGLLAGSSSAQHLGHDTWVILLMLMACVSAGVGLIASLFFARGENRQFKLRDLLLMVFFYAVALAIMQYIAQGSEEIKRLPDAVWRLILLQIFFHGALIGLCGFPVLARRGARLRTFGVVIPLLAAIVTLDIVFCHTFFGNQLHLGNFASAASFFFEVVVQLKLPGILLVWLTLFPADYALNLFHRPPKNPAPDA